MFRHRSFCSVSPRATQSAMRYRGHFVRGRPHFRHTADKHCHMLCAAANQMRDCFHTSSRFDTQIQRLRFPPRFLTRYIDVFRGRFRHMANDILLSFLSSLLLLLIYTGFASTARDRRERRIWLPCAQLGFKCAELRLMTPNTASASLDAYFHTAALASSHNFLIALLEAVARNRLRLI